MLVAFFFYDVMSGTSRCLLTALLSSGTSKNRFLLAAIILGNKLKLLPNGQRPKHDYSRTTRIM